MPFGLDPVYLLALPLFIAHSTIYTRRQARLAAMRRHPSARR